MFHAFKTHPETWHRCVVIAGMTAMIMVSPSVAAPSAIPAAELPITNIGPQHDPNKPNIVVIDAGGTLEATARDRISYLHYTGGIKGGVATILKDLYPVTWRGREYFRCADRRRSGRIGCGRQRGTI